MIIDEAHKIKNEESLLSMNVRSFNTYLINLKNIYSGPTSFYLLVPHYKIIFMNYGLY